jgi:hypothetical protein
MKSIRNLSVVLFVILLVSLSFAAETRGLQVVAKDKASGQQGIVKLYNKSYAVIIGIDAYKNLPHDRQLRYAVKDARGVEDLLRSRYSFDKIITLYNEEATRENILRVFMDDLPAEMSEEDSLLVFWAGHGNQEKTRTGKIGYLIPHNGIPEKLYTNISMNTLKEDISRKIPAKHVFYIMDACYGGLLTATRAVDKESRRDLAYLREITKEPVRQVLTAGGKGEEVLDGGRKGHSVFTGRLIQILEERGDFITANEIQAIIREKVYNEALSRNHKQTPGFGTFYGSGDFVFIPKIEKKIEDSKAQIAKLQEELNRVDQMEETAKKARDERKRREAAEQRRAAEAKLKAEQLRQKQLQEEEAKLEKIREENARFAEEQKQKELELTKSGREEAERLARLKAEVERRKKAAATVSEMDNIDAAVAEIKSLNRRIDEIQSAFGKELGDGRKRIAARYDSEISGVKQTLRSMKPLVKDEFETESEYRARVDKRKAGYEERIAELESAKEKELSDLASRISDEQSRQTADLRSSMKMLAEKEYTLNPEDLVVELGTYDVEKQRFPVRVKNKTVTGKKGKKTQVTATRKPGGIQVAVNGMIPLSRDEARKFQQEWKSGLIRPEVTAQAGSGQIRGVVLANDADSDRMQYQQGWFIKQSILKGDKRFIDLDHQTMLDTKTGVSYKVSGRLIDLDSQTIFDRKTGTINQIRGRFIDLDNVSMLDRKTGNVLQIREYFLDLKDGTVLDTRTNLMWAAKDNGAEINWQNAKSYCENYRGGGYSDWRMPTLDELVGLYDKNKTNRHGYHITDLIEVTNFAPWAYDTHGRGAAYVDFHNGSRGWGSPYYPSSSRALPVRTGK